jgi:hypothetical protein
MRRKLVYLLPTRSVRPMIALQTHWQKHALSALFYIKHVIGRVGKGMDLLSNHAIGTML